MDQHLIVLLPMSGAFCLAIGVVAGHWLRGGAVDPRLAQLKRNVRELMAERQGRQRQLEHVAARLADILEDPDPASARHKTREVQRWMTDRPLDG